VSGIVIDVETIITVQEFTERQARGRIYICRSCFDNRKQIMMLDYKPGEKSETIAGICAECKKAQAACIPCKYQRK
jgi:hypothetical protein